MTRLFDILFAALALLVLSPILLPVAILLRLTGEGEVFFRQKRVGLHGKTFRLWKFATMLKDSPNIGTGVLTLKNDPRVLPVGAFLRRTKINELPQLLNVLNGEMSLIGPRPQAVAIFAFFPRHMQEVLKTVRPGLSGIGSILFRDEESIIDRAADKEVFYAQVISPFKGEIECWYAENQSLQLYFTLIFLTAWVIAFPNSTLPWRMLAELPHPPPDLHEAMQLGTLVMHSEPHEAPEASRFPSAAQDQDITPGHLQPEASTTIQDFLFRNAGRPVVAVQGLGFVGSVMSFVCANALQADYAVIGVELPTNQGIDRVSAINDGRLHIASSDPKVTQYFEEARRRGNLLATWDASAMSHADVIIVDVNLDVSKQSSSSGVLQDFDVDLEPFEQAIRTIGQHCKESVLIIVETTVPPGTCQRVVQPVLLQELLKRGLRTDLIRLGHSYERVMPGPNYVDSIQNFYRVYSGIDEASAEATEAFLRTIIRTDEYPLTRLSNTNATEMAKVLENSYRSMNIAFMVEWSRFAEEAGVDLYAVVDAIRMRKTHSNMMLPGIGVGGYCLTKDPLLASWARRNLFGAPSGLGQSEQGVRINDQMPHFAFEFLRSRYKAKPLAQSKVLLLGAAYRGDVADTRFSPVEPFFKRLRDAGAYLTVHDYFIDYWPECDTAVCTDLDSAFDRANDIVVVCTGHTAYMMQDGLVEKLVRHPERLFVVDSIGLFSQAQLARVQSRHQVTVIGRGDIA